MTADLRSLLQAIYDQHGKLTPELVREEARPKDSPLHSRLEWDDAVAGEAYRLEQAHRLIQSVRVVYRPPAEGVEERSVRAFHAVRLQGGYSYEPIDRVAADPFLSRLVLADMEREWRELRRRYEHFEEFWELVRRDDNGQQAA